MEGSALNPCPCRQNTPRSALLSWLRIQLHRSCSRYPPRSAIHPYTPFPSRLRVWLAITSVNIPSATKPRSVVLLLLQSLSVWLSCLFVDCPPVKTCPTRPLSSQSHSIMACKPPHPVFYASSILLLVFLPWCPLRCSSFLGIHCAALPLSSIHPCLSYAVKIWVGL